MGALVMDILFSARSRRTSGKSGDRSASAQKTTQPRLGAIDTNFGAGSHVMNYLQALKTAWDYFGDEAMAIRGEDISPLSELIEQAENAPEVSGSWLAPSANLEVRLHTGGQLTTVAGNQIPAWAVSEAAPAGYSDSENEERAAADSRIGQVSTGIAPSPPLQTHSELVQPRRRYIYSEPTATTIYRLPFVRSSRRRGLCRGSQRRGIHPECIKCLDLRREFLLKE